MQIPCGDSIQTRYRRAINAILRRQTEKQYVYVR